MPHDTPEHRRLAEHYARRKHWMKWGPYLSERQWGTVREDYSPDGKVWTSFPHDHARSRAYRWGEDGIAGISDNHCNLCFGVSFWNERDAIVKERLFGLTGPEGNHGEDVKELYYYLDATPTHSYLRHLYKYPQAAFPYGDLVATNARRSKQVGEYEILDTGAFDDGRYFDVVTEYAKADERDVLIRITVHNRGADAAPIHVLPTLWARNLWSFVEVPRRPSIRLGTQGPDYQTLEVEHYALGAYTLYFAPADRVLFAENDTNDERLYGTPNPGPRVKDSINDAVVGGDYGAVTTVTVGTKCSPQYVAEVPGGGSREIRLRLRYRGGSVSATPTAGGPSGDRLGDPPRDPLGDAPGNPSGDAPGNPSGDASGDPFDDASGNPSDDASGNPSGDASGDLSGDALSDPLTDPLGEAFERCFAERRREADAFYATLHDPGISDDLKNIQRQALAGMIWTKQYYQLDVTTWLAGDPKQPPPPPARRHGRNAGWTTLFNEEVISMPDKWEYPWYAAWDLAFHCVPLAMVDAEFAKKQLILFLREWYMRPNGEIPAYEWNFSDVNPPVHAWGCMKVYRIDKAARGGRGDVTFLKRVFQKLLINFTWWVNKVDTNDNNIFEGGFLGLDNIGVFDRSKDIPGGGHLDQTDGTAWMAMYALNMLDMALEIAQADRSFEDVATKFFEHFVLIAESLNRITERDAGAWNEAEGFFYDILVMPDGTRTPLRIRSLVGLTTLFATMVMDRERLDELPDFRRRFAWHREHRPVANLSVSIQESPDGDILLALVPRERLRRMLRALLDEGEFFGPGGIRSLSKVHADGYAVEIAGEAFGLRYEPAESRSYLFGGNSNWRGPVWLPMNYLIIESLRNLNHYYRGSLDVVCPTGSGDGADLREVADDIAARLVSLFARDAEGRRPAHGAATVYRDDPHFRDLVLFYEYFDGDTGRGVGASHQTGWTGLVATLIGGMGAGVIADAPDGAAGDGVAGDGTAAERIAGDGTVGDRA